MSKLWLFEFKYYKLASAAQFFVWLIFPLKKNVDDRASILTFKCPPTQLGNGGKSGTILPFDCPYILEDRRAMYNYRAKLSGG
jgi:hypothetical protein